MDLEIECGFNTNDETINFGSRRIADNEPYESVTFASLRTKVNDSVSQKIMNLKAINIILHPLFKIY